MFSWFLTIVNLALINRIMTSVSLDCALRGLCVSHLLFCHCHRRVSPGNCCALSQSSRVNTVSRLNKAQTSARPSTALHTAWDRAPSKPSLCQQTPSQAKIRELNNCLFLCEANILWLFVKQHYCTSSKTISSECPLDRRGFLNCSLCIMIFISPNTVVVLIQKHSCCSSVHLKTWQWSWGTFY